MTTINIVVTEEAVEEEKSYMVAENTAGNKVTVMMIVGKTNRIRAKSHHGTINMEGIVRKLNW